MQTPAPAMIRVWVAPIPFSAARIRELNMETSVYYVFWKLTPK